MAAVVFIFVAVILSLMIVRLINECCEQQEWFSSKTENPSQPNGSHGIDGRIELVQHEHLANATVLHRVHRTSNVSSSQHFTGCGCQVNPIRLSNTVERIDDSQEE
ncbi:hypothetical protein DPMN_052721 [Dreissena polymorpha]|uniref:Secreted protein n=1 Tax=Dreissena polymorpha TaxID=45954 RepID=A0A9D4HPL3_DREPO|nr:hypothetical protein DPMN_052721 [Dreissena polymorpha]